MRLFAMIPESFSMVGNHHDDGSVTGASLPDPGKEPAYLAIHIGNLPVIGVVPILLAVGLRRLIGRVGIEVVRPEEPS